MTDVDWCPYTKLVKGDGYDPNATYYIDNGHYGFTAYEHESPAIFNRLILNGEIYRDDHKTTIDINDSCLDMLKAFINTNNKEKYYNYSSSSHPEITGTIYINNNTIIDEAYVSNIL
jgi:hypothetical protein